MAGISHLTDIYEKKGKEFVDKLFDKFVTVNEKLDASSFSFEKTPNQKFSFFKRNTEVPISMIDRTLMKLYEKPIHYFESLDSEILGKIPSNWRFGMEYFMSENPQEISYDKLPKNGLVLSYIHVKNSNGKLVRTIQDKAELDKWADLLGIERSPILFQGVLGTDQKIKILEFLDSSLEERTKKFKTKSFVKFIIGLLNPALTKTALNDDLNKSIEGVVFRFGDGDDKDVVLAKMVDPLFEVNAKKESEKKGDENNDIYQLTVIDLTNFINSLKLKKFPPKGKTIDQRYINFCNQVFNQFVEHFGDKYKDLSFNEPEFMKKKVFDVNIEFVDNDKTRDFIIENESYKKLYKILLASFRKKKKKATGMFTSDVLKQFNSTVDMVQQHLSTGIITESEETGIPTFGEYKILKSSYVEDDDDSDVESFISFSSDVMKEDDSVEKQTEEPKKKDKESKKPKNVNIMVGRFQPFHNGHLSMAKDLNEINDLPVVLVVVHPGHNKSGNSPFTPETVRSMLNTIKEDSDGIIKDFCMVDRGFIFDVVAKLRECGYEPVLWGAGEDRIDDYKKQLELNYKQDNQLELSDKFELVKTDRYGSGTEVRKAIEEGNFGLFKSLVPKSVQSVYTLLSKDIEKAKAAAEEQAKAKAEK